MMMTTSKIKTKRLQHQRCIVVAGMLLALLLLCDLVRATPMMYKKNTQDKYEADLVAVSSTVIPLTVLEVSYGLGGKPSEEYKMAYLKKLRKKVQRQHPVDETNVGENPDTLITLNKKQHDGNNSKAKVKGIPSN